MKPRLYCVNHSYALHVQVSFLAWSLMLLSLPVFGCVRKFCADKIATSYIFEGATYMPTLQICCQNNLLQTYAPDLPDPCKSAQACCWMPIRCPKKCLKTQSFFPQHCESLLFLAVSFLKICWIRPLMKLTKYVCDFFSFCFSDQMTTNSRHIKTGNLPTCSQES